MENQASPWLWHFEEEERFREYFKVWRIAKQVYDLQQKLRDLQQSGLPLYPSQGATVDLWQRSLERIQ